MENGGSLQDLEHNVLWRATAEKEKDVHIALSVFRGSTTFAVFDRNKTGGPIIKTPNMPRSFIGISKILLAELATAAPGKSTTCNINDKWDPVAKKMQTIGTLTYGVDEQGTPYLGIASNGMRYKFPIRTDLKYDFSGANLDKRVMNQAALMGLSEALSTDAAIAVRLSNFKRDPNAGGGRSGGGNRSGGGGYNSGGGNRGGGGNYGGGNSGGGGRSNNSDIEDSIPEF